MAQSETGSLGTAACSSKYIDGNVLNPIPILALDDYKRRMFFCLIISWINHRCVQRLLLILSVKVFIFRFK